MIDTRTESVKNILDSKIFSLLQSIAPGVPAVTLKQITTNVSEEYSRNIASTVDLGTTFQLNTIPSTIEGPVNPVNITNTNNGSGDIFSNLQPLLQQEYQSGFVESLSSSIITQLRNSLQPGQLTNLNFDNINSILPSILTPTIAQTINVSLSSSLDTVFNTNQVIEPNLPGATTFFELYDTDTALEKIDQEFLSTTASRALVEAEQFEINSSDNNEKLRVLSQGFTDPSANYPTKEYAGISETNKLATGDIRGTVVQKKNNERMLGAKLPYGESWDQPESPYRGQYPYNKVTQTEQGHIIEIDDTPGSERLHVYHKSGTFIEIDSNGSVVKRTKGSSYEIIDRNGKISIAGRADISINGACNIFVGNDANIEVEGDTNLTCHNDITAQAGGKFNISATEELNITSGNVNIQAYYNFNQKAGDKLNVHSSNVIHMHSNADIKVQGVDWYFYSENSFAETTGDMHFKAGGSSYISAETDINHVAGGSIYNDVGGNFHMASNNATDALSSDTSRIADSSNIGVLPGRKNIADNSVADPSYLTMADNKSLLLEEEFQTSADYEKHKTVLIASGYATASDIDSSPIILDSESPISAQTKLILPDDSLLNVNMLPGNYNLSPNFTVEQLSSKAAVTKDVIRGHGNLKYGDIVYNLQGIALNILEPIKKVYPSMLVTSAFRDPGNSSNSSSSQHPKGQAVDIQFKGVTREEYYSLAIKIAKIIKYDQLILEYCSYSNNPWIHISFSIQNNKNQVLTFFNHKKHSDGLSNLA